MHVLVLGGTRFIGRAAVHELVARGHEVTVFHRHASDVLPISVRHMLGDRAELEAHRAALVALSPDVVLETRAMTENDARALVALFETTRLVVLSSADVYRAHGRLWRHEPGPPDPTPLTEDAPLRERLHPYRDEPSVDAP